MAEIMHRPVMLEETLRYLVPPKPDSLMLDCTLGEGGHAEAFLSRYPHLLYAGIDADPEIQARARERLSVFAPRVVFLSGYFDEVLSSVCAEGEAGLAMNDGTFRRPDLVLFDLGISMYHFAASGRGFGYAKDEALDMRLSPGIDVSAADIVNREREEELARIIYEFGEERYSRRIARALVEARRMSPVRTTGRLADIVGGAVPAAYRHGRIHPATRTFQALRICVNDELGRAGRGISAAAKLLAPGGFLLVISFHSLEDRIAKNTFRSLAGRSPSVPEEPKHEKEGSAEFVIVTKKPIEPTQEECRSNPPSRSAKLRVAMKVAL